MHKVVYSYDDLDSELGLTSYLVRLIVCCEYYSVKPAQIKIIDFGSACMEDRTVYSYIQVPVGVMSMIICLYFTMLSQTNLLSS